MKTLKGGEPVRENTSTKSNNGKTKEMTKHVVEETEAGKNGIGGKIKMSEDVVATIAGIAARKVKGVHGLGKSRLIPFGNAHSRGISAEVGNMEAALDLEVVIEHGCDISEVAKELRTSVAEAVKSMANRQVVEVNLDIIGVHFEPDEKSTEGRVR
jgi:uncharacterized alkaline shock family protein YloU